MLFGVLRVNIDITKVSGCCDCGMYMCMLVTLSILIRGYKYKMPVIPFSDETDHLILSFLTTFAALLRFLQ